MKCETCGNDHVGDYGSGRFCSIGCANRRKFSASSCRKKSESLKRHYKNNPSPKRSYTCEVCAEVFVGKIRNGRKVHCSKCRRKVPKLRNNADSLFQLSKRTVSKILERAGKNSCAICGWSEGRCDIHHIIERKNGGTDDHNNLIIVCPNHHRLIHEKGAYSVEELREHSIANLFKDWKYYYAPPKVGVLHARINGKWEKVGTIINQFYFNESKKLIVEGPAPQAW